MLQMTFSIPMDLMILSIPTEPMIILITAQMMTFNSHKIYDLKTDIFNSHKTDNLTQLMIFSLPTQDDDHFNS